MTLCNGRGGRQKARIRKGAARVCRPDAHIAQSESPLCVDGLDERVEVSGVAFGEEMDLCADEMAEEEWSDEGHAVVGCLLSDVGARR